jgi:DNA-directed RNA polymerase specialized sigma subunit
MENKTELDVNHFITGREMRSQVYEILDRLDDTCKKIMLLSYFENLSMKEILINLEYENELVIRNKKYNCLKQIQQVFKSAPSLNPGLKNLFHG